MMSHSRPGLPLPAKPKVLTRSSKDVFGARVPEQSKRSPLDVPPYPTATSPAAGTHYLRGLNSCDYYRN